MRDIFWSDVVSQLLLNQWNNVSYESIRTLCDKLNLMELGKDVETGKVIKITSSEIKELVEMISKKDIDWAFEMLKYQITENVSSSDLLRNSDLSAKIDEYIAKDEAKTFKDSKDFYKKMDAAWGIYLKKYITSGWSEDTIFNMSTWMSLSLMNTCNRYNENKLSIVVDIAQWKFESYEQQASKSIWFAYRLNLIWQNLWFDKDPDKSENYELLNNPVKFSELTQRYLFEDMDLEGLQKEIEESKKEDKKFPKVNEEDKKKVDEIAKTFGKNFDQTAYNVWAAIVSHVTQPTVETAPSWEKQEKWRIDSILDKFGIDWELRKFINLILWFFGISETGKASNPLEKEEKELQEALQGFLWDDNSIKWTIFEWLRKTNPKIEIKLLQDIDTKTFKSIIKWRNWSTEKDRNKIFAKIFAVDWKLIKFTKEYALKDKSWNEVVFLSENQKDGKTERTVDLKNLGLYIEYYDKKFPDKNPLLD